MDARNPRTHRKMEASRIIPATPPVVGKIRRGDCVSVMSEWETECVDAIYADPPYNASRAGVSLPNNKTGGAYYKINEAWDSFQGDDYVQFTYKWIGQAARVLKRGGSLFISCSMHNIGEVIIAAKEMQLKQNNIIVWRKTNAMPSIAKRTFTYTTEYTCWFVKGTGWVFNYHDIKKYNPQKTKDGKPKQMPDFVELPIVQGRERVRGDNGNRALHPAQKPEKLIEVLLAATTKLGDIVLDPFMGTGTTAIVAEKLNRKWIGIEMESIYVSAAEKRICAARK